MKKALALPAFPAGAPPVVSMALPPGPCLQGVMSFLSLGLKSLQGKHLCFRKSLDLWKFLINIVKLVGLSLVFFQNFGSQLYVWGY